MISGAYDKLRIHCKSGRLMSPTNYSTLRYACHLSAAEFENHVDGRAVLEETVETDDVLLSKSPMQFHLTNYLPRRTRNNDDNATVIRRFEE